jgi:hypothetical protein
MISELKQLLFSILESAYQTPDVSATQQMGVNMSNAVKKEGVVIIQNQNVEVYARIVPAVVKAIKMCDNIPDIIQIEHTPMVPANETIDYDPIEECCKLLYDNETKWQDMQEVMKKRYLEYVVSKFPTKKMAAKWLGVGPTYLSKLIKEEKKDEPSAAGLDN